MTEISYTYTLEELQHLREIAAKVVALHGDVYLPIFECVHRELEARKQQTDLKALALKVAAG
jgi:hypothetical protein